MALVCSVPVVWYNPRQFKRQQMFADNTKYKAMEKVESKHTTTAMMNNEQEKKSKVTHQIQFRTCPGEEIFIAILTTCPAISSTVQW